MISVSPSRLLASTSLVMTLVAQVIGGGLLIMGEVMAANSPATITRLAPALPLIVNDPYMSVWATRDHPALSWPEHWSGRKLPLSIVIRVDGSSYTAMGIGEAIPMLHLKETVVSPCKTAYIYETGGVEFQVQFIAPKDPEDLLTLSLPLTFIELRAHSLDGKEHSVEWFTGIAGEWAPGRANEDVRVSPISIRGENSIGEEEDDKGTEDANSSSGATAGFLLEPIEQSPFEEEGDWPLWGVTAFASLGDPRLVDSPRGGISSTGARVGFLRGNMTELQDSFASGRLLRDAASRPEDLIGDDFLPIRRSDALAMSVTGLTLPGEGIAIWRIGIGNVYPVAAVMKDNDKPLGLSRLSYLWTGHFADERELLRYVTQHQDELIEVAAATDRKISNLTAEFGKSFTFLAELVFRQTLGGYVLVTDGEEKLMLGKEMSSGGYIQTVDVIFPASPFFLVLNPELLKMQLEPVFRYVESGEWLEPFAPHDLGHYPRAMGQTYPKPMPLEESGNMVLLAAAVWKETQDVDFIRRHYATLRGWAEYLAEHGESLEEQLFTDDFTGPSANNAHLSLKALLGVAAFARLAEAAGESGDARQFAERARAMRESWLFRAWAKDHFVRVFGEPGSWSLPYNLLFDEYLGLDVVPREFVEAEIKFLLDRRENYGIPLEERFKYTKADWLMWLVALSRDPVQRETIMEGILRMLRESPDRVPFTDWYETQDARNRGFRARSVMGGVYAAVLMCQKR